MSVNLTLRFVALKTNCEFRRIRFCVDCERSRSIFETSVDCWCVWCVYVRVCGVCVLMSACAEEKIDGANLGVSINDNNEIVFQNRGHFVNHAYASQWQPLQTWTEEHRAALWDLLEPEAGVKRILFGEWCVAKHSIHYTRLPGYFVAFDVWEEGRGFLSVRDRDALLASSDIPTIRCIATRRKFAMNELLTLLNETQSAYYDGPIEGIYLKYDDNGSDDEGVADENIGSKGRKKATKPTMSSTSATLATTSTTTATTSAKTTTTLNRDRAKIVRLDFIQQIDAHWTAAKLTKNIVNRDV